MFIKIAIEGGVPPIFLAWTRVTLAAMILVPAAAHGRVLRSVQGRTRWLALFAAVGIAIPFSLIATAEQHVASSLAAILIAAAPLLVTVLALRFDATERATGRRLIGIALGLMGVIALVGIDVVGQTDELLAAAAILLAALCYAVGPMIVTRHLADLDPRATMGASLLLAALLLAPGAVIEPPAETPSASAIVSLAVLGVPCTAAAYVLYAMLIAAVGAGRAVVITYVAPIVAVAVGAAILDEQPGPGSGAGLVLILAGSWLATDGRRPQSERGMGARPDCGP